MNCYRNTIPLFARRCSSLARHCPDMAPIADGIFAINKPKGLSSAQVVRDCQSCFNPSAMFAESLRQEAEKRAQEGMKARKRRRGRKARLEVKIGHGGTLDPLASGILILGVGRGTKSLSRFLECTKAYETVIVFGASSDSQDRVGKLLKKAPYDQITRDMVEKALPSYLGTIRQTPPIFSSLKMDGKPLYEYAREGLPIPRDIPTREVRVEQIELLEWYEPGSHRHFWPREQASEEEKRIAQKVEDALHPSNPALGHTNIPEPSGPTQSSGGNIPITSTPNTKEEISATAPHDPESGEKRKAEEEQEDDMVYEVPRKRLKYQTSPVMSGALPSDSEGTPVASGTPVPTSTPTPAPPEPTNTPQQGDDSRPPSNPEPTKEPARVGNPAASGGPPDPRPQPTSQIRKGKGSDLIPTDSPTAPPPWGTSVPGPPAAKIRLLVSSGFYVRTFCHDLGAQLGSAALMAELVRTRQGFFELDPAPAPPAPAQGEAEQESRGGDGPDSKTEASAPPAAVASSSGKYVLSYEALHGGEESWAPRVEGLLGKWAEFEAMEAKARQKWTEKGSSNNSENNNSKSASDLPPELQRQFWELRD